MKNSSRLEVVLRGLLKKTHIAFKRLPKNVRSNRWWLVWNGRIYFAVSAASNFLRKAPLASQELETLESLPRFVSLRHFLLRSYPDAGPTTGVILTELGMFGNMTVRLSSALFQANTHGLGHVVVPRDVVSFGGLFAEGVHKFSSRCQVWFSSTESPEKNPVAVIYTHSVLSRVPLPLSNHSQAGEQAWADLRTLLVPTTQREPFSPDHLVIHLRGGDVFGPRKPATYGQPPLGYYQLILGNEEWSHVTIVNQDDSNPVITGIVEECRVRGLEVDLQSSNLHDDLPVLLLARTLVAGRGSFAPAVVGLSDVASRVFFFEDKFALWPPKEGVRLHRISDQRGDYVRQVLSNNWENSPEQHALMLSYPSENLVLEKS